VTWAGVGGRGGRGDDRQRHAELAHGACRLAQLHIDHIEACSSCKHYSLAGPSSCQEEGRPKKTIRLKPGSSQVAARVDDRSVTPFLGTWELRPDTAYFNCFFIVVR